MEYDKFVLFNFVMILNIHSTLECPHELADAKATYKAGERRDQSAPVTLDTIKRKLQESGIFDHRDETLSARERKELARLFDAVEIMTASRSRQPASAQSVFSALRLLERALKKQLKEGRLSEALAAKFRWERLSARPARARPAYRLDERAHMRVFDLSP